MAWGAIASGIGSLLGGALSGAGQIGANLMSFGQNKELQQRNFDYQERMSNTAYQRAMADMDKAGLNPLLVTNNGGASTPSGSSASMSTPDISGAIASGAKMSAEIRNLRNAAENIKADTALKGEQAKTEGVKRNNIAAETGLNNLMQAYQRVVNSNAPAKFKAEIKELVTRAYANNINANANQANAASARMNAYTEIKNAETNMLEYRRRKEETEAMRRFQAEHPVLSGLGVAGNSILPMAAIGAGAYTVGKGVKNKYFKRKVGF